MLPPPKKKPKAAKADENQRVLTLTAMFSQDRVCTGKGFNKANRWSQFNGVSSFCGGEGRAAGNNNKVFERQYQDKWGVCFPWLSFEKGGGAIYYSLCIAAKVVKSSFTLVCKNLRK